ncbi:MAG: DUF1573 domain-containing protein [Saprospiraceae bacterium]|nr:DUF1573 domain-containing protein [Saprospiraceae bacterium]
MKKLLFALTMMLMVVGLAAQEATKATKKAAKAEMEEIKEDAPVYGPKMTFENMVMDYGEISKGSDPLRKFTFVNDGTEPLVIKSAKGSCGCTVPDYPKEPVLPGEAASIDVRYDTQREGQFTKTVTLTTNINEEKIVLTIKGKVNPLPAEESVPAKEGSIF